MDAVYEVGGLEMLDRVRPLWQELNQTMEAKSIYFSEYFQNNSFEKRMRPVREKVVEGHIRIEVAVVNGKDIGYCVSSVSKDRLGEIDSIFVQRVHRDGGIGGDLLDRGLEWMQVRGAERIVLSVTYGNEDAPRFYERHGFRPRMTVFEWKG